MKKKKLTQKEVEKIGMRIYDDFIKLVEGKHPEYALGILESIKGAYFLIAWDKAKKKKK